MNQFVVTAIASDSAVLQMRLTAYTTGSEVSQANFALPDGGAVEVPFSSFSASSGAGADLSNVNNLFLSVSTWQATGWQFLTRSGPSARWLFSPTASSRTPLGSRCSARGAPLPAPCRRLPRVADARPGFLPLSNRTLPAAGASVVHTWRIDSPRPSCRSDTGKSNCLDRLARYTDAPGRLEHLALVRWKSGIPGSRELRDAKREAVLREASASFNRFGYHGTSLDDLAQRLNVTKPALYYYFPNKQAMLKACFDQAMDVAFENLARARRHRGNGRQKLLLALSDLLEYLISEHSVAITVLEDGSLVPEDLAAVKAARRRFEHALRAMLREGIKDGSIVPCDPKLTVLALLGTLSAVPRWYKSDGSWSRQKLNTQMLALLERMISTQPTGNLSPRRRASG